MSCPTDCFIYPVAGGYAGSGWLSLAEGLMLRAIHGAMAALMPTAMTETAGKQVLSNALYEAIFSRDERILGAAVASVSISAAQSSSGGRGGGCFIASADWDLSPDLLRPLAAMALLICLGWRSGASRLEERSAENRLA